MAKIKEIKIRLFQNEEEIFPADEIIVDADNAFSLQNESDPYPAMTIGMDHRGNLLINTNSYKYIRDKMKEGAQG